MKKKELLRICADFETSYINKDQLLLPKEKRERYTDSCYYRINSEPIGVLINNGENTITDFLNQLLDITKINKDKQVTVYFHNLEYDWSYILYHLNKLGVTVDKKLHSWSYEELNDGNLLYGTKLYFSYRNKGNKFHNYTISFIDSYKLFPTSIANMGKMLGLPKGDDFDYDKIRDYNYRLNDNEKEYIKRDVDILVEYMNQSPDYMKEKITLASNAFNLYKNEYLPKEFIDLQGRKVDLNKYESKTRFKILFPNHNKFKMNVRQGINSDGTLGKPLYESSMNQCNNYFKQYYFGGLTMVNPLYKGKLIINKNYKDKNKLIKYCEENNREYVITENREIIIDVNSLYPFIMKTAKLPYGLPTVVSFPSLKELNKHYSSNFVFLKLTNVWGELKQGYLPFIPKNKMDKLGASVLYKTGFSGDTIGCNLDEFKLLTKHYNIVSYEIELAYIFNSTVGLFDEYVTHFTNEKIKYSKKLLNGDKNPNYNPIKRNNAKLLQNTLYGKFGMNPDRKSVYRCYDFNEECWKSDNIKENAYKNKEYIYPIIASAITSYARQYVLSIIDSLDYTQFVYMDTDSVHFVENDKNNLETLIKKGLINGSELGKFDHENSTNCSIYLAPKKYAFIDLETNELVVKCAGLPDGAKEKISTIDEFYYGYITNDKLQKRYCKGGIDLIEIQYRILSPKDSVYENLQYSQI